MSLSIIKLKIKHTQYWHLNALSAVEKLEKKWLLYVIQLKHFVCNQHVRSNYKMTFVVGCRRCAAAHRKVVRLVSCPSGRWQLLGSMR